MSDRDRGCFKISPCLTRDVESLRLTWRKYFPRKEHIIAALPVECCGLPPPHSDFLSDSVATPGLCSSLCLHAAPLSGRRIGSSRYETWKFKLDNTCQIAILQFYNKPFQNSNDSPRDRRTPYALLNAQRPVRPYDLRTLLCMATHKVPRLTRGAITDQTDRQMVRARHRQSCTVGSSKRAVAVSSHTQTVLATSRRASGTSWARRAWV